MAMRACLKCQENNWIFKKIENLVNATCVGCGYEVEFTAKKPGEISAGDQCRKCEGKIVYKESKFKPSKLLKPYYYLGVYRCLKCKTTYLAEKYKVINKMYEGKEYQNVGEVKCGR